MTEAKEINAKEKISITKILRPSHLITILAIIGCSLLVAENNFLLFHSTAEIFSILISSCIFVILWNSKEFLKDNYLLTIGIAYLFIGMLDLLHMLSYKGLNILHGGSDYDLASQLWIIARYIESTAFLLALAIPKSVKPALIFFGYFLLTAIALLSVFYFKNFPITFYYSSGLTDFKVYSEYLICLIVAISIGFLFLKRKEFEQSIFTFLIISLVITIGSEISFTKYADVFGFSNIVGHILKIISFYFIYLAVVQSALTEPLSILFRSLDMKTKLIEGHKKELKLKVEERTKDLENSHSQLLTSNQHLQESQTELIKARDRAERASNVKSEFLAIMNHELRTPMNGVMGMAQILMHEAKGTEQFTELEVIYNSGKALVSILDDIIELTRLEEQKKQVRFSEFSLTESLQKLYNMYLPSAKVKHLDFFLEVDLKNPKVIGDEDIIHKILSNILSNSIKFTENGLIKLHVYEVSKSDQWESIRFEITDTGIGISGSQKESIFQTFTQGDSSTTRKFGGLGLGLSLAKKLTELIEGDIGFHSKLGEGTTFWVETALKAAPQGFKQSQANLVSPSVRLQTDTAFHILVVEDDPTNQAIIEKILNRFNCNCSFASDGEEALTMVQGFHFDCILMDVLMPVMDGFQATLAIRNLEAKGFIEGHLPVIALTAKALSEDKIQCLESGMDGYLKKPINIEHLKESIFEHTGFQLILNSKKEPSNEGDQLS